MQPNRAVSGVVTSWVVCAVVETSLEVVDSVTCCAEPTSGAGVATRVGAAPGEVSVTVADGIGIGVAWVRPVPGSAAHGPDGVGGCDDAAVSVPEPQALTARAPVRMVAQTVAVDLRDRRRLRRIGRAAILDEAGVGDTAVSVLHASGMMDGWTTQRPTAPPRVPTSR